MLTAVPRLVADIAQRPPSSDVVELGGDMYFLTGSESFGRHLWKADGSLGGTQLVKEVGEGHNSANVTGLASIGGALYFTGPMGLWRSDGTTQGTQALGSGELVYGKAMDVGGHVVFLASNVNYGFELWTTDGTPGGTQVLQDISPGSGGGVPYLASDQTALYNGRLFFVANDPDYGSELWTTDGTSAGTVMLRDMNEGAADSAPQLVLAANGKLWFSADDGIHGRELWVSDGTPTGTHIMADINPTGDGIGFRYEIAQVGSELLFEANDGTHGRELWRSDGTAQGTTLVADLTPGAAGTYPKQFAVLHDTLLFLAKDGSGYDLWRSGGTPETTRLVTELYAGTYDWSHVLLNDEIYYYCWISDGVPGLWQTDGTPEQTQLVLELPPSSYRTSNLAVAGDNLFFTAKDDSGQSQLWVSDGSAVNTRVIAPPTADRYFAVRYSDPLYGVGNEVFFTASDEGELWRSDGTDAGTFATEIAPGRYARANPAEFAYQDGTLVFAATHPNYGHETWRFPVASTEVALTQDGGQVELLLENGELVVREADAEILRAPRDEITFLDFTGNVQVSQLRVDLSGGNPLPREGISFGDSCGAPQQFILENGSADWLTIPYRWVTSERFPLTDISSELSIGSIVKWRTAWKSEQLWDDIAAHWTDEDFEELLAQFVSPDDRPTDQWDL